MSIAICEYDTCNSYGGVTITADKEIDNLFVPLRGYSPINGPSLDVNAPNDVVQGTVKVEGDAPLPRFRVRFVTGAVTRTAAVDGRTFTASLPRGDYRVEISDLPPGYEVRSIRDGVSDLGFWPLSIAPPRDDSSPVGPTPRLEITIGIRRPEP